MKINEAIDGAGKLIELIKDDMHLVRKYQDTMDGGTIITIKSTTPNSKALSLEDDDMIDIMRLVKEKMRAKVAKAISRLEIAANIAEGYLDAVETRTEEEIDIKDVKPDVAPVPDPKITISSVEIPEKKSTRGVEYRRIRSEIGEDMIAKYVDDMFSMAYTFDAVQSKLKCSPATLTEIMDKYSIVSSRKRHGANGLKKVTAAGLPDPIEYAKSHREKPVVKEKPKSLSEINDIARSQGMTYGQYMQEEEKKRLKGEARQEG